MREGVAAAHFYFDAFYATDPQDTKHLQSSASSHVFESAVFGVFGEARLKIAHEGVNGWITGPLGWVAGWLGVFQFFASPTPTISPPKKFRAAADVETPKAHQEMSSPTANT